MVDEYGKRAASGEDRHDVAQAENPDVLVVARLLDAIVREMPKQFRGQGADVQKQVEVNRLSSQAVYFRVHVTVVNP